MGKKKGNGGNSQKPQQSQQEQATGAWGRGAPISATSAQTPQPQQPQGAWGRGAPISATSAQMPQPQQPQGAWGRGAPISGTSAQTPQPQQPQGAWGRGRATPGTSSEHQQSQKQQATGALGRGRPIPVIGEQPPQPQQPQGAWGRGTATPGTSSEHQQSQKQQATGALGRGRPIPVIGEQPPQPQQPQGAWGRGKITAVISEQPPQPQQPQGAWGRGKATPGTSSEHQQSQKQQATAAMGKGKPIPVIGEQPPGARGRAKLLCVESQPATKEPYINYGGDASMPQQSSIGGGTIKPQITGTGDAPTFETEKQQKPCEYQKQVEIKVKKDQAIKSNDLKRSDLVKFTPRIPAKNPSGRAILVQTNHFAIKIANPNIKVYHYDVAMVPDTPKYLLRAAWNKFVEEHFKGRITIFDGRKNAFSKDRLIENGTYNGTVTVFNSESGKNREFQMTIQEVRCVDLSVLVNFKDLLKTTTKLPEAEVTVLELILKNWPSNTLIQSGRSFFTRMESRPPVVPLSNRLVLRLGHYQSVSLGKQLYLNFDIAHKAFYRSQDMLQLIETFKDRNGLNTEEMNKFIKGMSVVYKLPRNDVPEVVYRCNGLVQSADKQTFEIEGGRKITVAEYFERDKKCRLSYPQLPLLWVGPHQKTIYLPLEFCRVAEDIVYKGEIDPMETREMVKNATSDARKRRHDTMQAFSRVNYRNEYMREFGISVTGEMEKVQARVLDAPTLKTMGNIYVKDGVWRTKDFLEPKSLRNWCILNLDKYAKKDALTNFQNMIKNKGKDFRMDISNPQPTLNVGNRDPELRNALASLKGMQLVFVVIPEMKGLYPKVKTICETEEGILTQCVRSRTVNQDQRKIGTTIDNILLKVNAKLGGKNHCLEGNSMPRCLSGYVMIVGADVTHSGPGSKIPSVAAVAVSCDANAFQYGITTRVQEGEIIRDMEEIITHHLHNFRRLRQSFPEKIIMFRDGVSEGELLLMVHTEVAAIRNACRKVGKPDVKVTFIVVQKRHHTRLYPTSERNEVGKNFNVPVGTCVDTDIVHPRDLDFYLVSHASILGTARPTRYRVVVNDNGIDDDEIERTAYYLCHMFSRCNRSVSYPSPTYNAHLAAFRVRSYLETLHITKDLKYVQNQLKDKISEMNPMFFV
ncbi:hypothetical protein RUM43_007082 [Polyplax serrata]|uniref:Uncharacterized protein n=1 Tax=Polyplax serrata TaxID=468196 RepID=A0AAN8PLT9_POLSC